MCVDYEKLKYYYNQVDLIVLGSILLKFISLNESCWSNSLINKSDIIYSKNKLWSRSRNWSIAQLHKVISYDDILQFVICYVYEKYTRSSITPLCVHVFPLHRCMYMYFHYTSVCTCISITPLYVHVFPLHLCMYMYCYANMKLMTAKYKWLPKYFIHVS